MDFDNFYECIIVGGGTCGLAAAARLCESFPGSIYTEDEHQRFHWLKQRQNANLVRGKKHQQAKLDPSEVLVLDLVLDKFMGQWNQQFAQCQIPYLRSPMFFHPDPVNVDGMISYAHLNRRSGPDDLMEIKNVVGKEWSKHQMKKQTAKHRKKTPFPTSDESGPTAKQSNGLTHDRPGIVDINMRDYRDYYRPSTKFFLDFCSDVVRRYGLQDLIRKDEVLNISYGHMNVNGESGNGFTVKTESGVFGCKICIVASGHRGRKNFPLQQFDPLGVDKCCHTSHVFSGEVLFPPKSLTSESSVVIVGGGLTAAQLAHVCVLKNIKVYWVMRDSLKVKHFDFHLDWVTKYKNVKKSAFYMLDSDEERLDMINEARQGGSVNPEYYKRLLKHAKEGKVEILQKNEIKSANWTDRWEVELSDRTLKADYIVCATGMTADVENLPFLKDIVKSHHMEFIRGFPCLDDNLQWGDIPLFMIGKNASLRTGPSSANLDGARLGAERIGWYVQEQRAAGKYDWLQKCVPRKMDWYDTQLKLASGQMNWFSLLRE